VREYGDSVKRVGFLSFGHWSDAYGSQVRTAADALVQSLELAVAAEELGAERGRRIAPVDAEQHYEVITVSPGTLSRR
jgi:hypothetical protein